MAIFRGKRLLRKENELRLYTAQGAASASGRHVIETYSTPFALSYKASHYEIGLLSSLSSFASTLAFIPGSKMIERFRSRKAVWLSSAILFRIFWIPLLLLPFLIPQGESQFAVWTIIIVLAVAEFFKSFRYPASSGMISDAVPARMRGTYFGRRNMIIGITALVAILASGQILLTYGFGWTFAFAIILGLLSIVLIARVPDKGFQGFVFRREYKPDYREAVRTIRMNRNFFMFTLFMIIFYFSVRFTSPFFTVYMLDSLEIGYFWFTIAVIIRQLVEIIANPYWGKLSDRLGDRHMLKVTALPIALIPLAWVFASSPTDAILIEAFSGFAWAGFDLATFNFLIGASPDKKRPAFLAVHQTIRGPALLIGALTGGIAAEAMKDSGWAAGSIWLSGIQAFFLIGFVMRAVSSLFIPFLREPRPTRRIGGILENFLVQPAKGAIYSAEEFPKHFKKGIFGFVLRVLYKGRLWVAGKRESQFRRLLKSIRRFLRLG